MHKVHEHSLKPILMYIMENKQYKGNDANISRSDFVANITMLQLHSTWSEMEQLTRGIFLNYSYNDIQSLVQKLGLRWHLP